MQNFVVSVYCLLLSGCVFAGEEAVGRQFAVGAMIFNDDFSDLCVSGGSNDGLDQHVDLCVTGSRRVVSTVVKHGALVVGDLSFPHQ